MAVFGRQPWMAVTSWGLVTSLLCSWSVGANEAETQENRSSALRADEVITVVATKQQRLLHEVVGTVSVVSADQLRAAMVVDAADLARHELGMTLDNGSTRFANSGFRIRGVGGNRTAVVLDNVALADSFAVGSFANTGRGLMELGLVNRVEILRGPASTLYGSDALGGVVALQSVSADDVLRDQRRGAQVSLGTSTDAQRYYGTTMVALAGHQYDVLVAGARRQQSELRANKVAPHARDQQKVEQHGALIKVRHFTTSGTWQLSFDALRESRDTKLVHNLGSGRLRNTTALRSADQRYDWRAILQFKSHPHRFADHSEWRVYWQSSSTQQRTFEARERLLEPVDIFRGFRFDYNNQGAAFDAEKLLQWGAVRHRLGYGAEFSRTEVWNERDAWQWNRVTEQLTTSLLGEQFPLRDFPRSVIGEAGIYLHNEMRVFDGQLRVIPGLRYESYALNLRDDALFAQRYPQSEPSELREQAWLPKFGAVWQASAQLSVFAQYARGYRAPPFADVNIGLYYPQFNVIAIANPDLRAESGNTLELGLRWRSALTRLSASLYDNRYRDFIQSRAPLGFDPQQQLLVFQSVNRDSVRIKGLELRWQQQWSQRWETHLEFQLSAGEDHVSGAQLDGISPAEAIVKVNYYAPSGRWQTSLISRASQRQRTRYNTEQTALYQAPGYIVYDWLTQWQLTESSQLNLGVMNLFDRHYWQSGRTFGYLEDAPILPLLAEAGRHFRVNFELKF